MPKENQKGGRPPFEPTDEDRQFVTKAVGYGLTYEQVASLITNPQTGNPLNRETLAKHFPEELEAGKSEAALKVSRTAYRLAVSGETPAMTMFWLKTQCGWRETTHLDHSSSDGTMTPPNRIELVTPDDDS